MSSYRELYFYLFGQIADALDQLEEGNFLLAMQTLKNAHVKAEKIVMETDVMTEDS